MDIRLAGTLNGIEAAQQIQASHHIPLIFMTGYADGKVHATDIRPQPRRVVYKTLTNPYTARNNGFDLLTP